METKEIEIQAAKELEKGYGEAEALLNNEDKLEEFIQRIENKLKVIPHIGDKLSHIPVFISLVKSYMKKEYVKPPFGTMLAIVSALLYFLVPVDFIPDIIPGLGHLDDAAVITACLCLVDSDIKEYIEWRDENGKKLVL